jgi:hypothetical protein
LKLIPVNTAAALPIFALKPMSTFTSPSGNQQKGAFFGFFVMILINLPQLHFQRGSGAISIRSNKELG